MVPLVGSPSSRCISPPDVSYDSERQATVLTLDLPRHTSSLRRDPPARSNSSRHLPRSSTHIYASRGLYRRRLLCQVRRQTLGDGRGIIRLPCQGRARCSGLQGIGSTRSHHWSAAEPRRRARRTSGVGSGREGFDQGQSFDHMVIQTSQRLRGSRVSLNTALCEGDQRLY